MRVEIIFDPSPVWDHIKEALCDQGGELIDSGEFLGAFDGDTMAGAFFIRPLSTYCMDVHGGIHPDYYGKGREICREMIEHLFKTTLCLKIVVFIPAFNRLARNSAIKIGFKEEGILTRSFLKYMRLHDQHIYGLTKTEGLSCHQ